MYEVNTQNVSQSIYRVKSRKSQSLSLSYLHRTKLSSFNITEKEVKWTVF